MQDWQKIHRVEQAAAGQYKEHPTLVRLQRAQAQVPFADETGDRRRPDHAEGTDGKRRHGPGHTPARHRSSR